MIGGNKAIRRSHYNENVLLEVCYYGLDMKREKSFIPCEPSLEFNRRPLRIFGFEFY